MLLLIRWLIFAVQALQSVGELYTLSTGTKVPESERIICQEDQDLGPGLQEEKEDLQGKEKEKDTDAVVLGPPEENLGHLTEPGNTDQGHQGTRKEKKRRGKENHSRKRK